MSGSFLDRGQLVGYKFEEKTLVVTMTDKTAQKMKADGWDIQHSEEVGHFLSISMEQTE